MLIEKEEGRNLKGKKQIKEIFIQRPKQLGSEIRKLFRPLGVIGFVCFIVACFTISTSLGLLPTEVTVYEEPEKTIKIDISEKQQPTNS